jgi:transcriptional regulator with XRE-family HTH domain
MLRVNRLLGGDEELSRLSAFAAAYADGAGAFADTEAGYGDIALGGLVRRGAVPLSPGRHGPAGLNGARAPRRRGNGVSESTISRWETGKAPVSYSVLRRYEQVLGLTPGLLVATADTINRYSAPAATGPPALSRDFGESGRPLQARLEELLELATSSATMSGRDWDLLTGILSVMPEVVIVPRRIWGDIAERLLEETIVADGLPWMQRYEALNRLLGHPAGQEAAAAACMSLVADPTNQVFVEPVSVLDASSHPGASRLVLGQLTNPINERTRYGALLACIRKVRYGHFTTEQMVGLVPIVLEMLDDPDSHEDAGALGVALLRRLPRNMWQGAGAALTRALAGDRTLSEVLSVGRLAARAQAGFVVDRLVAGAVGRLGREAPGFTDDLLPSLIDEVLYAPILDVRLYGALLLGSTPYGRAVAAAAAVELAKPQVLADATLASSLLGVLRILGQATERPLVERLIVASGVAPEVSQAAVSSIGHVGGASSERFWLDAIALFGGGWRRHRDRHSARALTGLVYGLGIARNLGMLSRVRGDGLCQRAALTSAAMTSAGAAARLGPA